MGLVQDSKQFVKDAWNAVDEVGGDIPPNKNLANLPEGIASVPTGPVSPKSLEQLKRLIDQGREIAVGAEIPDTWNGNDNPLIVAQNLNPTNNSSYSGAVGVILIRKYVDPISQRFSPIGSSGVDYTTSMVRDYLDNDYLSSCSDDLRGMLSNINVPYYNGSAVTQLSSKWFLMSDYEVCSNRSAAATGSNVEGIMWQYWKDQTGLSAPNSGANDGRILRDNTNTARPSWLRTRYNNASSVCNTSNNGSVNFNDAVTYLGVLPACFIGKD